MGEKVSFDTIDIQIVKIAPATLAVLFPEKQTRDKWEVGTPRTGRVTSTDMLYIKFLCAVGGPR